MNEQRRIMELFKERRKSRKKKGNNNNKSSANEGTSDGVSDGGGTGTGTLAGSTSTPSDGRGSNETNAQENERIKTDSNNPNEPEHVKEKDDIPSMTTNTTSTSSIPASPTPSNATTTTTSTSSSSTTKKKKRKKRRSTLRSSSTTSSDGVEGGGGGGDDNNLGEDSDHNQQQQQQQSEMLKSIPSAGDENSIDANGWEQPQQQQKSVSPSRNTPQPPPGLGGTTIPPPGFQDSFSSSLRLDDTDHDNTTNSGLNEGFNGVGNDSLGSSSHLDPLPLHGDFDTTPLHQQPQQRQESNHSLEPNSISSSIHSQSRILPTTDTSTATTSTSMNATTTTTSSATPTYQDNNNPLHQSFSHHHQRRYIIIPEIDRPNVITSSSLLQPKTSLAVAAAKAFVDLYYPHILHGLSSDLAMYYTPQAQKSISVGGAHSVVASQSDIMIQLSRFSGSNFVVRGVVSQDTFDGHGAHILVTGIVQTTLNNGLTSFAHSISLVRKEQDLIRSSFTTGSSFSSDDAYSFQIHNDALSLLTVSDMIANEQQN